MAFDYQDVTLTAAEQYAIKLAQLRKALQIALTELKAGLGSDYSAAFTVMGLHENLEAFVTDFQAAELTVNEIGNAYVDLGYSQDTWANIKPNFLAMRTNLTALATTLYSNGHLLTHTIQPGPIRVYDRPLTTGQDNTFETAIDLVLAEIE